jgi:hypothetical protein
MRVKLSYRCKVFVQLLLGHARAAVGNGERALGFVEGEVDFRVFEIGLLRRANDRAVVGVLDHLAHGDLGVRVDVFAKHAEQAGEVNLDLVLTHVSGWMKVTERVG